ncbi:hypothetical protein [uncultured Winogradskyella sp.]|uniref:hypothetical protein n=1 Tax=uncultured Winogradskyella sp. TaxID=395353 RepID=UPI002637C4C5|nr:hypothetical protein [uncultured Winogradskyella sp.]
MKRVFVFFICFGTLIFWSSCRNDFEFSPSTGNLEFERDTVYLDTVFTNIGSSTYNLKVYNRSNEDIVIPNIQLENGVNSFYRMNVDGGTGSDAVIGTPQEGKFFEDVELLAKDSLFIFIETTIDIETLSNTDTQFLYTDRILFDSGNNQQEVELVTLVKDAVFIFPSRDPNTEIIETLTFDVDGDGNPNETNLQGRFLQNDELTFTNEKPYVIYGYAGVGNGQTLTMEAGTRVNFHSESGIIVTQGGSLNINGGLSPNQDTLENEVILEGDRLEPLFEDVPGQWGTIWLFPGSLNNSIEYATIKNATIGVLAEGGRDDMDDKLRIENTKIYNSSAFGILGRATSITAENVIINNSGQSSFAGTVGGKYNFTHCTIANYWNNSFRQFPSLLLNDFLTDENGLPVNNTSTDLIEANFTNCIIYGNDNPEFLLESISDNFNFKFTNCLLRFDNDDLEGTTNYQFDDIALYENNSFNTDPEFEDPFENLMRIGENSGANSIAVPLTPSGFDILNVQRDAVTPDAGAYESTSIED